LRQILAACVKTLAGQYRGSGSDAISGHIVGASAATAREFAAMATVPNVRHRCFGTSQLKFLPFAIGICL